MNMKKSADDSCASYVLIHNGLEKEAPFLGAGQFCGNKTGVVNATTGSNKALVRYYFEKRVMGDNFLLSYKEISADCGGQFVLTKETSSVVITSPNYPNIPSAHSECAWTVTAPNGELIGIEFKDRFDITVTPDCEKEYVEILDGGTISAHLVGRFCGDSPDMMRSSSNLIRIKYFTEVVIPKNGFKLVASIAKCGGFYKSASSGVIKSEGYPGLGAYPTYSTCNYRVQGRIGSAINFTFTDLNLPDVYETSCDQTDRLIFYNVFPDANNTENELLDEIGTYCGMQYPEFVIGDGPEILIQFITLNANGKYRGFKITFESIAEQCGGDIEAESGTITSPGYPNGRKTRRFCEWRITVPKGRRVKLNVVDLDLMDSSTEVSVHYGRSFRQRVGIYNDHTFASRIKLLTPNDTQTTINSTDNTMLIAMWLYSNIGHRGFKFTFTSDESSICVGNFNDAEGTIITPIVPADSTLYCQYVRTVAASSTAPPNGTLAIKLSEIRASNDTSCTSVMVIGVTVRFEMFGSTHFFYRKCESNTVRFNTLLSSYTRPEIIVRNGFLFRSTRAQQQRFDYKTHNCGGTLNSGKDMMTKITQPSFPIGYGEVYCAWHFASVTGMRVNINVSHSKMDCAEEFLMITEHPNPLMWSGDDFKKCGDAVNGTIEMVHASGAFIEYHSKNYNPNTQFSIEFQSSYSLCGGPIQWPILKFRSPLNGTQYPNQVECVWDITSKSGYNIGLEFVERFFLEDSVNCTKDYVEVFDMVNSNWTSLGRFCGRTMPKPFNSTGREMRLVFRTNDRIAGDGFVVKWSQVCGGIFYVTSEERTLTSPGYPLYYPKNIFCNYTFLTPKKNQYVNLVFNDFEMEDTVHNCRYDNVSIYRQSDYGDPGQMTEVGTFCVAGSLSSMRYGNPITILLRTDSWLERRGFKITYSLDKCGGIVNNETMIKYPSIQTSMTQATYENIECLWNITAPPNQNILIQFGWFSLYQSYNCHFEYIQIFEGTNVDDSKLKAKICGNLTMHNKAVLVNSNKAVVKLLSGSYGTNNNNGIVGAIRFVTPCSHDIELTESNLVYNLDQLYTAYPANLNCHYKIIAPKGYFISVTFEQFHVAKCVTPNVTSCSCDYVEIRDGPGLFSELITEPLCGFETPAKVVSTRNSLWLRFATDSTENSTGFKAQVRAQPTLCGKDEYYLNGTTSEITMEPPRRLPATEKIRCRWYITSDYDENLEIQFDELNLPCADGFIEIIDDNVEKIITEGTGVDTTYSGKSAYVLTPSFYGGKHFSVATHRYCGTEKPHDFYSASSSVQIKYTQESSTTSTFKLRIKLLKACSRNYTSLQGRLYGRKSADCMTHITVPQNYTITLYFTKFEYNSAGLLVCTNNTAPLKIIDTISGKELRALCANSKPNPIFTNSSALTLNFNKFEVSWSDYYGLYDITYVATDKGCGCGGQIFNYAGSFSSPYYPDNVRRISECRWDVRVPDNLRIAIQFEIFDLGSKSTCNDNYLQLIEMNDVGAETVVRQFCGEDKPFPYKGNGNVLSVKFKTTTNFAGTGWVINFMSVDPGADINENSNIHY